MEIWKHIVGFEGRYEVSSRGNVRSYMNKAGNKMSKPHNVITKRKSQKYHCMSLYKYGVKITKCLHVIVLEAFVGPRPNMYEAAHIDGDRENNNLYNLMWATKEENMHHRDIHLKTCRGETVGTSKLTKKEVSEIRAIRSKHGSQPRGVKSPYSLSGLANKFNVSKKAILDIVQCKRWEHVGVSNG